MPSLIGSNIARSVSWKIENAIKKDFMIFLEFRIGKLRT
jgi:hypothetical protein